MELRNLERYVNNLLMNYINSGVFPKECERNLEKKINTFSKGVYLHEKRKNLLIP